MNKGYYDVELGNVKYEFYDLNISPMGYISTTNESQIDSISFNFSKGIKINDNGSVEFSINDLEIYKEVMVEVIKCVEPELQTELFICYQNYLDEFYDE